MMVVRTTRKISPLFRFCTILFLLLLVFALAPEGLNAHTEPAIGLVLSHEKSLPVSAAVAKAPLSDPTIPTRNVPSTPMQVQLGSRSFVIIDESEDILTNNHKAAP
jgi:S1-C subfamily serine protease